MEPLTLFDLPAPEPDPVIAAHPVGEVMRTSDGPWGAATATYDITERYRYRVSRVWDPAVPRRVCWVMLNPSRATETIVDPTVERTLRYARAWGCGASEVVNCFAYRARQPADMKAQEDPVGPGNDEAILAASLAADLVIAGWGVNATHNGRDLEVRALLAGHGVELCYLRLTKDGHPGHPLYLPKTLEPVVWNPPH